MSTTRACGVLSGAMHRTVDVQEFERWLNEPVSVGDLLADLTPPKHFAHATFSNYRIDDRFPSQLQTIGTLRDFIHSSRREPSILSRLVRFKPAPGKGIYIDGGFGVGKTHLLAACYHGCHVKRAYLSFQELMFLVGLQGLAETVRTFSGHKLLFIDEFELDDPANTRITTNLLGQLLELGVSIVATSNTPPGALGEEKFSVEAFRQELGDLFLKFTSVRLDGEDYRAGHKPAASGRRSRSNPQRTLRLPFVRLLQLLASAHPIRVRSAVARTPSISIEEARQIDDPHAALRFVYFIDKVYDDDVALQFDSGIPTKSLFSASILKGGDTKKYLRAISRLEELTLLE